ncbi:MAG TPA: hypothetical protein VM240_01045 [Verrucomicrobiae bacterium]|nr:hypothetical protein [Verrucomicrobiae bacterium]
MSTASTAPATATSPAAAPGTQASQPAPIPFRNSGVTSGGEVFGILATTLLLLAAVAAAAWYARRKGWLDRWANAPAASGNAPATRLRVVDRLRLSRRTTVFRIADGQGEYLLVESDHGATLVAAATGAAP